MKRKRERKAKADNVSVGRRDCLVLSFPLRAAIAVAARQLFPEEVDISLSSSAAESERKERERERKREQRERKRRSCKSIGMPFFAPPPPRQMLLLVLFLATLPSLRLPRSPLPHRGRCRDSERGGPHAEDEQGTGKSTSPSPLCCRRKETGGRRRRRAATGGDGVFFFHSIGLPNPLTSAWFAPGLTDCDRR